MEASVINLARGLHLLNQGRVTFTQTVNCAESFSSHLHPHLHPFYGASATVGVVASQLGILEFLRWSVHV